MSYLIYFHKKITTENGNAAMTVQHRWWQGGIV